MMRIKADYSRFLSLMKHILDILDNRKAAVKEILGQQVHYPSFSRGLRHKTVKNNQVRFVNTKKSRESVSGNILS